MKRTIICVDVDGTLKKLDDSWNHDLIDLIKKMSVLCDIYIWSGGGAEYAMRARLDSGLAPYTKRAISKSKLMEPDITFDDQDIKLGKVNIKV